MKIAIYSRLSAPDRDGPAQLEFLRQFAHQRELQTIAEYTDEGSRAKKRMPGLDTLLHDARLGRFSAVLVPSLDRLAVSLTHLLKLAAEFTKYHTNLISVEGGLDTSTPAGNEFFPAMALLSRCEVELKRQRIRSGMRRSRLEGIRLGRTPLDVDHIAVARDRLSGMSLTTVARKYGISRASVIRFVREQQREQVAIATIMGAQLEATCVM